MWKPARSPTVNGKRLSRSASGTVARTESRECGAHDSVRIGAVLFRDLDGDERGEIVRRSDQQPLAVTRSCRPPAVPMMRKPLPMSSLIGSRFSRLTPCFFSTSVSMVFSIWE